MPSPVPSVDDVPGLTYEQARAALVAVVQTLEAGAETLDESLALWERGEALADRCAELLDGARARLAAARGTAGTAGTAVDDAVPHPGEKTDAPVDEPRNTNAVPRPSEGTPA
jgi:exodeoxyribonuclease VII small subunit